MRTKAVAVDRTLHPRLQYALAIHGKQTVPLAAPDDLDDVPRGPAEAALQLLDNLAVAADRPVEALQVAVDDQHQVVELRPGGDINGSKHLGLIGFAVADEGPDLAAVVRL